MTTSDIEWQRVTTNDNEWYTTSDNEWQRVTISANFSFFHIGEEPTTKHPKENSLNFKEDLWRRPIELRAETSTQEEILTVRSRNCRSSCPQIFIKISVLKNFAIFTTAVLESLVKKVAGLEARTSIKRFQHRSFHVNIAKFLRTDFSIEQLWWLLLELRHFFSLWYMHKIYENSMTQNNLMISLSVDSGHSGKYSFEILHEYL